MEGIYPDNFEIKIGFDRIREMLKARCISLLGEAWADRMHFMASADPIREMLDETNEFLRIVVEFPYFPADHYLDVREALTRVRPEGRFIETEELFNLRQMLETLRAISNFFTRERAALLPALSRKAARIRVFPLLVEQIDRILTKQGKIRENATPELARVMKSIRDLQAAVSNRLQLILKQAQQEGWIEEGVGVAVRDGRAVIPVPSANKRKLKGIIFDESATGKTSFIEPADIVEMNNGIRELEYAARREIVKILTAISQEIRPAIPDLVSSNELMGEMDFIRAKALFAKDINAIRPDFSGEVVLDWKQAVHPLLMLSLRRENRAIVPLDIHLNQVKPILVISGPNAGGKSVCLKTVGLLQYMLQNGLLIPLQEGSKTGVFQRLFIDIGDEQSIENDLSTYSSHLLAMKYFLRHCDEKTLVLIDEFGTGTEPMLGGAIAEAVLDRLNQLKTFGVITTHYTNLKHFAASAEGIVNGAMLYDSEKMAPLFILETGKPGSSFAFEIARKIGLPEDILQNATGKIGKKQVDFEKNLRSITRDKYYWETKRQRIRSVEKTVDGMAETYSKELEEIRQQRKAILKQAREEAQQILAGVNRQIENAIREIRESQADKEQTQVIRKALDHLKKEVSLPEVPEDPQLALREVTLQKREYRRKRGEVVVPVTDPSDAGGEKDPLVPGDRVTLKGRETVGELIRIAGKKAVVAFGQMQSNVLTSDLEKATEGERVPAPGIRARSGVAMTLDFSERRLNFKSEIDLRGVRTDEALARTLTFIDEAVMFGVSRLRILHGKGHGILKEMIRNYLKTEPVVKSFRDEHEQFGGAGITIVELSL